MPWQTALGAVFISGVAVVLSVSHVREEIVNAVPGTSRMPLAGIGLFIAFIGFKGSGIMVADPATRGHWQP